MTSVDPGPLLLEFQADADGVLLVSVCGEIDFASASSLQARVIAACERERAASVILDITQVQFMDSTGLQTLLQLRRELSRDQGVLVLLGTNDDVMRVFQITGVDQHLALADTLAQAHELIALLRTQEAVGEPD